MKTLSQERIEAILKICHPDRCDGIHKSPHITKSSLINELLTIYQIASNQQYYDYAKQKWVDAKNM